VFDTNAALLDDDQYEEFGVPYMNLIASKVKEACPSALLISFPKDRPSPSFGKSKFDCISLSSSTDINEARQIYGGKCLQGNLDPKVLYESDEEIRRKSYEMVAQFGTQGYIANLGHGMEPAMSPDSLAVFIQSVKEASKTS